MKDLFFPIILGIAGGLCAFGLVHLAQVSSSESDQFRSTSRSVKSELLLRGPSNGLHRVTIDDSVTVLIYKHYEGVSMIRVK